MVTASLSIMATRITKWTREAGGRKDFVDPTRKSHQPLKVHLSEDETKKLRELARVERKERKKRSGEGEGKEDSVMRRRIEKLRAELHGFALDEKESRPLSAPGRKGEEVGTKSVEELRQEAAKREKTLSRVRLYIPPIVVPTTPKERGRRIHAKMLQERAVQMKEKEYKIKEKRENDDMWGKVVVSNHEKYLDDLWREKFHKIENRDRLKEDLDKLCIERAQRKAAEHAERVRMRQNIECSDQVYAQYQAHLRKQADEKKRQTREAALREIEDIRKCKVDEAAKEDQLREEDLRYSAVRRAYARRVKQRILDKMKGEHTIQVKDLEEVLGREG